MMVYAYWIGLFAHTLVIIILKGHNKWNVWPKTGNLKQDPELCHYLESLKPTNFQFLVFALNIIKDFYDYVHIEN